MQSASYIWQPKVNTSLQNPSALHTKCIGGEACIDHSDKHLTLQEHMLLLLKLLIALNIFSYCGRFATNCSLVGRCCPPPWGPTHLLLLQRTLWSVGKACQGLCLSTQGWPRKRLGWSGCSFHCGSLSCFVVCLFPLPSLACYLKPSAQVRESVLFPSTLHRDLHSRLQQ